MDKSITQLAKKTLDNTKMLIKLMDEAQYPYDRAAIVQLLSSLKVLHDKADGKGVADHLERSISEFEKLEHAYYEWMYEKEHGDLSLDTKNILGSFKELALYISQTPSWRQLLFGRDKMYRVLGWIQIVGLCVLLLLGGSMIGGWGAHMLWYILIWISLCTFGTLILQWLYSWTGRLAVILLGIGCFWIFF